MSHPLIRRSVSILVMISLRLVQGVSLTRSSSLESASSDSARRQACAPCLLSVIFELITLNYTLTSTTPLIS